MGTGKINKDKKVITNVFVGTRGSDYVSVLGLEETSGYLGDASHTIKHSGEKVNKILLESNRTHD